MTHTYAPNYFEQTSAQNLLGGLVGANQSVVMTVDAGSAILYGVHVNNASGDATLQIARATAD